MRSFLRLGAAGIAALIASTATAVTPPRSASGQSDLVLVIWDSVAQVS